MYEWRASLTRKLLRPIVRDFKRKNEVLEQRVSRLEKKVNIFNILCQMAILHTFLFNTCSKTCDKISYLENLGASPYVGNETVLTILQPRKHTF